MKHKFSLIILAAAIFGGCSDPKAEELAQKQLDLENAKVAGYKEVIKTLPGMQHDNMEAEVRIARLEKERDALKKAGH